MADLSRILLRLAIKDLRVGSRYLGVVIPFYLAYGLMFFVVSDAYFAVNALFIFLLTVGSIFLDWKSKGDLLFASLPTNRSSMVIGRYLGSGILIIIGTGVCIGYGYLLAMFIPSAATDFGLSAVSNALYPFLTGIVVFVSILFPWYFAYGLGKGLMFFFGTLAAVAVLYIAIQLITGASLLLSEIPVPRSPFLPLVWIALLTASAFIAVKVYSHRDF